MRHSHWAAFGAAFLLTAPAVAQLRPPEGYYAEATVKQGDAERCPETPKPYTGDLLIPSKYEGSGKARDKFNADSYKRYKQLSADINELEKGVNKQVAAYLRLGRPGYVDCTLTWLDSWAKAQALLSTTYTHTGKSMRKWALGSVSSAYLRLKYSRSRPLQGREAQTRPIEAWLGQVADQVVVDWRDQPRDRLNNHQYWAAWAVMAASVVVDRRDLFDWSVAQFRFGASQVNADGYLPNELGRDTRALAYHNYAMGPLMMIAAFAQANGVDLREENQGAMRRLAGRIEEGIKDPGTFERKTGYKQKMEDLDEDGKFAWLEPYCALYNCSAQTNRWRQSAEPMKTYRLGGDITQLFAGPKD
ncbi:mannuronate-specific alginate lyase [Pseudomonas sp. R5(2019)]|uniref:mannuronate-specific alginate lyase n=1 Tax=Pseudomonas sp. R5(2019) TaxID=2697566 RepID=UPI0014120BDA|nr:mannuronate-specific alginate lyase [Pseudomonas sp. R5(2019)]NBA94862.1 mannuronate-specific alginate lyase [Pseudomonas sp. R5(2019)]